MYGPNGTDRLRLEATDCRSSWWLCTAYAAQGLTLHGGVVVGLRRAGSLGDDDWWLAIYVMLSRAQQLTNLILVGFREQVEDQTYMLPEKRHRVQVERLRT